MKDIIWFKDISEGDIGSVGGKGLNLGIMYNLKLPVPPGFVVTAQSYQKFLEETKLDKKIYSLLRNLDIQDTAKLEKTAKQVQELILDQEVPERVANEIKFAYENISIDLSVYKTASKAALDIIKAGRDIPWVAVRSSATAEDLPEASFAGQQETFLNIKGADNVTRAVQRCWASLFTARAIYYRIKNNFEHEKVLIAVVIQKMIDSETSGVMFSINPATSNKNEIVIEAGFGLGEAIVGGQITPDTYIVDKNSYEIRDKRFQHNPGCMPVMKLLEKRIRYS